MTPDSISEEKLVKCVLLTFAKQQFFTANSQVFTYHSFLRQRNQDGKQAWETTAGSGNQEQPWKGNKLGRQGDSGKEQPRREIWKGGRQGSQGQPRKGIMKGDKLGRQSGSGS